MNDVLIICDPHGPLGALIHKQECTIVDPRGPSVMCCFKMQPETLATWSYFSCKWQQWFGILNSTDDGDRPVGREMRGGVYAVDLAASPPSVMWETAIAGTEIIAGPSSSDTIVVLCEGDTAVHLNRQTGVVVRRERGVEDIRCFGPDGAACVLRSDRALVYTIEGRRTILDGPPLSKRRTILGAARAADLLAVSWAGGGITIYDAATGRQAATMPQSVFIVRMVWNPDLRRLLGFGNLDRLGGFMPISVDPMRATGERLEVTLPDQREYCGGEFCDDGRFAFLENGYIWNVSTNAVYPIPAALNGRSSVDG